MKEIELKIPNLGEAEDTEIIEISVKKGDKLRKNDPIIVLESEKAAMEVPSDFDGKIINIKVKEGDSVREGTVFAVIEVEENEEPKEEKEEIRKKKVLRFRERRKKRNWTHIVRYEKRCHLASKRLRNGGKFVKEECEDWSTKNEV